MTLVVTEAITTPAPATTSSSSSSTIRVTSAERTETTAERILRLFPNDVNPSVIGSGCVQSQGDEDMAMYDEEQVRLMDEVCIVLDENDQPIGSGSKKTCHLMSNIYQGLLHRAFSVFLFDKENRLLLQQRASEKITFPDLWTNTCCSHPLGIPGETGTTLEESITGVKRAAVRKLEHELGIPPGQVPIDQFHFLTRIHYMSSSDEKWGEHEIDYILLIKPTANITLDINQNEVQASKYVSQDDLKTMLGDKRVAFTPWFKLICQSMLYTWWDSLDKGLEKHTNEPEIRRMLD